MRIMCAAGGLTDTPCTAPATVAIAKPTNFDELLYEMWGTCDLHLAGALETKPAILTADVVALFRIGEVL